MLKQTNSTIINLVLKVSNPRSLIGCRPISCYNVLYKLISKIFVVRLRGVLERLVHSDQYAFIQGKRIVGSFILTWPFIRVSQLKNDRITNQI